MKDTDLPQPIYLLSLPRAGSTLLQRLLASHPDIVTTSEPNILLFPLLSLQPHGVYSLLDHEYFLSAIGEFADRMPRGSENLFSEIAHYARRLYAKASPRPTRYFLDKSPAYCFVATNLLRVFPEGKYIFLWRHPLAVVASMLMYPGANHRQWSMYRRPHAYEGLASLVDAYQQNRTKAIAVRYEELARSPSAVLAELLQYMDLPDHDLVGDLASVQIPGTLYDPNARLPAYQVVRTDRIDAWKTAFGNRLRKRWARRYLHWIGEDRLAIMGYDLDEILAELDAVPLSLDLLARDAYWMTYGFFYRLFNGRLLRDNFRKWRAGEPFWAYR